LQLVHSSDLRHEPSILHAGGCVKLRTPFSEA
jgi:hypothetical protein